jgi:hypothetical protein
MSTREEKRRRRKLSIPGQARSHCRPLAVHPTRFEPWPTHSQPVPIRVSTPSPRGQQVVHGLASLRLFAWDFDTTEQEHLNPRITRDAYHRKCGDRILIAVWLPHVCCLSLFVRAEPAGCTRHTDAPAIHLREVSANALRQRQISSPQHQRAVLRPRGHDKLSRGTVSCVRASARKSYRSLIARTTAHPVRDSLHLMAHSRRANAKILLVFFLHLHLSRVLGHRYSVHATAVRRPSHESVALSDPALVHEIPARVQLQAAVVHDTIPMSQSLAHHWRLDVPAHTV